MKTSDPLLDRVRRLHHLRSFIIASVVRIGIVALMLIAMLADTPRAEWAQQIVLLVLYAIVAVSALIMAFTHAGRSMLHRRDYQFPFIIVDVLVLTAFQFLSTNGYFPLLCMTLLPFLVALDVSWRRAAVVLACSLVGFAVAVLQDPVMVHQMGWGKTYFRFALFAFFCYMAFMAVRAIERHNNTVAGLSALQEELLADTMTATEVVQRRISESIHDGPLQDVLAARRELAELAAIAPGHEHVEYAQTCLQHASERLREATFELHPAVLDHVGLGAAVEQLASSFTAQRSGITIATDIDYPIRSTVDPILFGVVRELLSNVMRHSRATHASVTLGITDKRCLLDVADNGIGMTSETAAHRLGEGHIGLASHRTRVEAAGGKFTILEEPAGTHIRVELPLRR